MEELYDNGKVEKAVSAIFEAVNPLEVNLLELAQAARAVYLACEMKIAENMKLADEQREAMLEKLRAAV